MEKAEEHHIIAVDSNDEGDDDEKAISPDRVC
jgi:hypothetical protein